MTSEPGARPAGQPGNWFPEGSVGLSPDVAADRVSEQLAFTIKLAALGFNGTIRPDMFPPMVVMPLDNGRIEVSGEVSAEALRAHMSNLIVGAISVAAQVINKALEDTFGGHPLDRLNPGGVPLSPEELSDLDAAREVIYMLRTAVSHDPYRPTWQCRGLRVGMFRIREIDCVFDSTTLDGKPLDMRNIGGLDKYVSLVQFCQRAIRRASGRVEETAKPQPVRDWLQRVELNELVPPNAVAVRFAYRIEPANGRVALHRTRHDSHPTWLSGPSGEIEIELDEPQVVYFETIGAETRLSLDVRGYRHAEWEGGPKWEH